MKPGKSLPSIGDGLVSVVVGFDFLVGHQRGTALAVVPGRQLGTLSAHLLLVLLRRSHLRLLSPGVVLLAHGGNLQRVEGDRPAGLWVRYREAAGQQNDELFRSIG